MSDFITFGRTKIYYINEQYEIETGIVDVVNYENLGGKESPNDIFVVRHKISDNNYEHINLTREEIRFDLCEIKDLLIEKLKEHIQKNNAGEITISNLEDIDDKDIYGYLYKSDADIFKDECQEVKFKDLMFEFNPYLLPEITEYKLIIKIDGKLYSTEITNATIYNGQLDKFDIDFNNCKEIEYPEDYENYKLTITDIDEKYVGNRYFFELKFGNEFVSYTSELYVVSIDANGKIQITLENNHFIPNDTEMIISIGEDYLDLEYNLLQYWVPEKNKHYELYLNFTDDNDKKIASYKYNDYITFEDLTDNLPITFASFKEVK